MGRRWGGGGGGASSGDDDNKNGGGFQIVLGSRIFSARSEILGFVVVAWLVGCLAGLAKTTLDLRSLVVVALVLVALWVLDGDANNLN